MSLNLKLYFLLPISLLVFLFLSINFFEVTGHAAVDTRVGIGFDDSSSSGSIQDSNSNRSEGDLEDKLLPITKLPQLGQFIEPMIVILLGLLIWLAALSLILMRRYMKKEGDV